MILIISRKQSKVIIVCLWKINEKCINVVNSKIHMSKVKRKKKKSHCIHQRQNFQEKDVTCQKDQNKSGEVPLRGASSPVCAFKVFERSLNENIYSENYFYCHEVQLVKRSRYQLSATASSSLSENKMSSSSASSKPWNVEASLSDVLPNNSSRALSFLPSFFAPPLPATMKTSASEQHRQGHTLSQLF